MLNTKNAIFLICLIGSVPFAQASEGDFTCQHEGPLRTIYVTVQPIELQGGRPYGVFQATISEKDKFTYSIPGEPLPVLAKYDKVYFSYLNVYYTPDGQFRLFVGEDGVPSHLRAGILDMDLPSCSQN